MTVGRKSTGSGPPSRETHEQPPDARKTRSVLAREQRREVACQRTRRGVASGPLGQGGYVSPMSYLIVDDRDGSVIAEFERVEDAVRMVKSAPTLCSAPLRLVVFDDT